jgi:hypothetical protein
MEFVQKTFDDWFLIVQLSRDLIGFVHELLNLLDRFRSVFIVLDRFDRIHLCTSEEIIKFTRFTISTRITEKGISFIRIGKSAICDIERHSRHNSDKYLDSPPPPPPPPLNYIEDIGMSSILTSTRRMPWVATLFRRNRHIQSLDDMPRSEWLDRSSHLSFEGASGERSWPRTICCLDYSLDRRWLGLAIGCRRIESFSLLCDV